MDIDIVDTALDEPYAGLIAAQARVQAALAQRAASLALPVVASATPPTLQTVFDDIANFFRDIYNLFRWDAWTPGSLLYYLRTGVFEPALNWLRDNIWGPVWGWFHSAGQGIGDWIKGIRDSIEYRVTSVVNGVNGAITWLRSWFSDSFQWIITSIQDRFWEIRNWLVYTASTFFQAVSSRLQEVRDWIVNTATSLWQNIVDRFWDVRNWLVNTATSLWQNIVDRVWEIRDWLRNVAGPAIQGVWAGIVGWVTNFVTEVRALAGTVWEAVRDWVSNLWNTVVAGIRAFWPKLVDWAKDIVERVEAGAKTFIESLWGAFRDLPGTITGWALANAGTNLGMEPSRALGLAGGAYGIAIGAGTLSHVTATALNVIPTTNWVGASQFAAYISELAGFKPITDAVYGSLIRQVIGWPLQYHYNQVTRPRIPTEGEIFAMGRKRGLNRGEFAQAMAFQGIPDWWIDKMYTFFWSDPSPYWLLRMSENANPQLTPSEPMRRWLDEWLPNWQSDPWGWYKAKLMLAGFEDTDIPPFIEGFQRRYVASAITQYKTSVRAMVREGYWGRSDAEAALRPLQVRQEEIDLMVVAEDLDYQNKFNDGQVQFYIEAYRKGELTAQDLSLVLSTIIIKPERVAQIVSRERVRALPKPKAIVPAAENSLVLSVQRSAMNAWLAAYRKYEITEQDLLQGLILVLRDSTLAQHVYDAELTRYRPPPAPPEPTQEEAIVAATRRSAIASWVAKFRVGEIDADQLELVLQPLIEDPEIRNQLISLEKLRALPEAGTEALIEEDPSLAATRQAYVQAHIEMFQDRTIALEELFSFLMADGLSEDLSRATVISQAQRRIKAPKLDSPYYLRDIVQELMDQGLEEYEGMYLSNLITLDQYVLWLTQLGIDPDVITFLADSLALQRFIESG